IIGALLGFAVAGTGFGFAHSFDLLLATRFIQGLAAAALWSGALTWLINSYPATQRGAVIGTAIGVAVAGALFGPAIGALARETSTELVFTAAAVVALVIAVAVFFIPDVTVRNSERLPKILRSMGTRPIAFGAALVAVPSIMFG